MTAHLPGKMCAAVILVASSVLFTAASSPPALNPTEMPATALHLVRVGSRNVGFHVIAGKTPAVLFEAGGGLDGSSWAPVLESIYRRTGAELITFDRAGFGASDEDQRPTELQHEVDDLKDGLAALGVMRGIVLVAHSFGGEPSLVFAKENSGWVASAVLVDANIPAFFTDEETSKVLATSPRHFDTTTKEGRTMNGLMKAFPNMQRDFRKMQWPSEIPMTLIVLESPPLATQAGNTLWITDHEKFAQGASNRIFIMARRSGHMVMKDRPDLVSDTVVAAVQHARTARSAACLHP